MFLHLLTLILESHEPRNVGGHHMKSESKGYAIEGRAQ